MSADISGCHTGEGVLLATAGWRPGTLLNVLQGPGRPTSERHPAPNVTTVVVEILLVCHF